MIENESTPDIDSMTDDQVHDLAGKMSAGEAPSAPVEPEAPGKIIEVDDEGFASDDQGDTGGAEESEPASDKPEGERTKSEFVRFGKFEQERQRRLTAETRAQEASDRVRIAEERIAQLIQTFSPKPEAEAPVEAPSLEVNPVAFIGDVAKQVTDLKQSIAQQQQETQQRQMFDASKSEFSRAVQSDPEMTPAYTHVLNSFANELRLYGYKTPQDAGYSPDADLNRELNRLETQNVFYALQNKIPLNTYIKGIAASRGWSSPPPQPEAQGNDVAARLADKEQIKRQAASLTSGGGSPARTGAPTPQEIMDMTDEQFAKFREKHDVRTAFSGN